MATKAEQFREEAQRTGRSKHTSKRKPKKAAWSHDKAHAGSKATHAFEEGVKGRPSRESTRKGANRTKADSARNATEQTRQGSPSARARRTGVKGAKGKRVRGS